MRLILFLVFAAALWQGGGYFQSPNLTALSLALLFLPPVMLVVSLYLKKSLKGRILSSGAQLQQGSDSGLHFEVNNRGRLPALGFRAELQSVYLRDRTSKKPRLNRRDWQRKKERRILNGGVDGKETWSRDISVQTPWCGLMEISVKRLYVSDYLKFFRCRVRKNQKLLTAVMPASAPVLLRFSEDRDLLSEMMRSNQKGSGFPDSEVHQLREYRPGDGRRSIHWKQSARTDKTWVKEYSQEDPVVTLTLELYGAAAGTEDINRFYEILYSLLRGFLTENLQILVRWEKRQKVVSQEGDLPGLFWQLYEQEPSFYPGRENPEEALRPADCLCLDLDGKLYWDGILVHQFEGAAPKKEEGVQTVYLGGEGR